MTTTRNRFNTFKTMLVRKETEDKDSVIVVAARMDTLTLFDQTEVGFNSPTTGIVTLLSVARAVSRAVSSSQQYR